MVAIPYDAHLEGLIPSLKIDVIVVRVGICRTDAIVLELTPKILIVFWSHFGGIASIIIDGDRPTDPYALGCRGVASGAV